MNLRTGIIDGLPFPGRLVLGAAVLFSLAVAFYFDAIIGFWAFLGPILIVNLWTEQRIGKFTRAESPAVFWGMLGLLVLPTFIGVIAIFEKIAESTP